MRRAIWIGLAAGALASPALAQDKDDAICAERPGLSTDACVMDKGRAQIETSLADWTLQRDRGERTDTILIGDSLLRYGIGHDIELRLGWTPYGIVRDAEPGGEVDHAHRTGDVTLGAKAALLSPSGDGKLSVSAVASASVPAGRRPVGAGDWGATFLLPVSYALTDKVTFQATPVAAAAVDDDGRGRHPYYGSAFEAEYAFTDAFNVELSAQIVRDDDPDRTVRGTPALGSVAFAWQPDRNTQLDLGTNVGLNRAAPDVEVYAGVSRRF